MIDLNKYIHDQRLRRTLVGDRGDERRSADFEQREPGKVLELVVSDVHRRHSVAAGNHFEQFVLVTFGDGILHVVSQRAGGRLQLENFEFGLDVPGVEADGDQIVHRRRRLVVGVSQRLVVGVVVQHRVVPFLVDAFMSVAVSVSATCRMLRGRKRLSRDEKRVFDVRDVALAFPGFAESARITSLCRYYFVVRNGVFGIRNRVDRNILLRSVVMKSESRRARRR